MSLSKIKSVKEIGGVVKALRAEAPSTRVVTTNGAFDILHVGHVRSLERARSFGDVLIVGLNSDSSIRQYKSPLRPIIPERDRAELLSALACVDYVVIFEETTPNRLLEVIQPNVHVKSRSGFKGVEREVVERFGGRIELIDDIPGISTTWIVSRIVEVENNSGRRG